MVSKNKYDRGFREDWGKVGPLENLFNTHIAQIIAKTCQEYFQSFIATETFLSNIAKYFIETLQFSLFEIFLKTNKYLIVLEIL